MITHKLLSPPLLNPLCELPKCGIVRRATFSHRTSRYTLPMDVRIIIMIMIMIIIINDNNNNCYYHTIYYCYCYYYHYCPFSNDRNNLTDYCTIVCLVLSICIVIIIINNNANTNNDNDHHIIIIIIQYYSHYYYYYYYYTIARDACARDQDARRDIRRVVLKNAAR